MKLFMREYKWEIIMWVIVLEGLLNNFMTVRNAFVISYFWLVRNQF